MSLDQVVHRLFVEGQSDCMVVNQLVGRRLQLDVAIPGKRIVEFSRGDGGFEWVRDQLETALVAQTYQRFGAVVDRDGSDGKPDRWHSMRELLRTHKISAEDVSAEGLVATTSWGARVGLWLMPRNTTPGDLETFLEELVPKASTDWKWAGEATARAKTEGAEYRDADARKARLHTWLARRDPPANPYGTAIRATHLGDTSPAADAFVDWFKRLFLDPL